MTAPYEPSLTNRARYTIRHDDDLVAHLRSMVLVPWATGKCQSCGSTLCEDPLGHRCGPVWTHHEATIL